MTQTTIASWLLTYLVHSTILLGTAWAVSRLLGERRLSLQETLLRLALVSGLLTSGLQLGLGVQPLAGKFEMNAPEMARVVDSNTKVISIPGADAAAIPEAEVSPRRIHTAWPVILLTLWGTGAALGLLGLGRSMLDLRRLLRTRRFRPVGRIVEYLAAAMGLRSEVRLSTSKAIAVPFATGIRQPEICCPERIHDLAPVHQTSLFAHELAHIARRDPAWQLLYRIGEAVLVLQPLNRIVRRRLEEISEHLTDERAVACTGNRLGLARCLVVLAHWGSAARLGAPAAAFAAGPRLDRRINRLIGGKMDEKSSPWTVLSVIVLLAAAGLVLPAVAPVSANSSVGSDVPADVTERTWSTTEDAPAAVLPAPASPPEQPAPPDERVPDAPVAPPVPEAAPAPAAAPTSSDLPAADTAPEPVLQPAPAAPAAQPVAAPDAPPAPVSQPVHPAQPAPRSPAEEDEMTERARERAERRAMAAAERNDEAQKRAADRARVEAERQARRAEYQEQRLCDAEERAARTAVAAEERARERACRMAEDRERIAAQVDRLRERAAALEKEAERRAVEHRIRAEERSMERARVAASEARRREEDFMIQRERAIQERARVLAEEARKLAEEAKMKALEEKKAAEPEKPVD
ncbi:MAG: M56 family metallopeptidase [Holophagae bacterium]|jgi:beta-lactamase regulating signal transducer with metallopeptidase domain